MENIKSKYWIELSDYDIITAEAMLNSKRYLYVGFMCHQSIEKILKAYFVKRKNDTPPYTHNLTKLCEQTSLLELLSDEQKDLIFSLQPLNIEARYPSYKENILRSLNEKICTELLNKTKELRIWVKQML